MSNYIFDMDGTILDSMPYWRRLAREYVCEKNGIIPEAFDETVYSMDLNECAEYLKDTVGIDMNVEDMKSDVINIINNHYAEDIPMKNGMKELLTEKKAAGCRMCIFTTSDKACAETALNRLGIRDCFEKIYTVYDIGINKKYPESYLKICHLMKFEPEDTWVYEDVIHGVKSAKEAGCKVTAVYDEDSSHLWSEISALADRTINP